MESLPLCIATGVVLFYQRLCCNSRFQIGLSTQRVWSVIKNDAIMTCCFKRCELMRSRVRHCRSLARAGELLLCSAADAASCAVWFSARDYRGYLAIVVGLLGASHALASFALGSFALARIPFCLLGSVASA